VKAEHFEEIGWNDCVVWCTKPDRTPIKNHLAKQVTARNPSKDQGVLCLILICLSSKLRLRINLHSKKRDTKQKYYFFCIHGMSI